jgi:hypothetical protein
VGPGVPNVVYVMYCSAGVVACAIAIVAAVQLGLDQESTHCMT